jgi:hypothetical protein
MGRKSAALHFSTEEEGDHPNALHQNMMKAVDSINTSSNVIECLMDGIGGHIRDKKIKDIIFPTCTDRELRVIEKSVPIYFKQSDSRIDDI